MLPWCHFRWDATAWKHENPYQAAWQSIWRVLWRPRPKTWKERIEISPICESANCWCRQGPATPATPGNAVGRFGDLCLQPDCNNLAKNQYRWGQNVDVVVTPTKPPAMVTVSFAVESSDGLPYNGLKWSIPLSPSDGAWFLRHHRRTNWHVLKHNRLVQSIAKKYRTIIMPELSGVSPSNHHGLGT